MDYLWAGMILAGVLFSAFYGTLQDVAVAAVESAKEAVTLCVTMLGVMSFWTGLMNIAQENGMIMGLSKKLIPFLKWIFPNVPKDHIANEYIATNVIANMFGLGWAATPAGLKAMESLKQLEQQRRDGVVKSKKKVFDSDTANNEMCTFLILNISSLQLIPVNIIAYRSQYGSVNPAQITGPALLATAFSTLCAIIFCKCMELLCKRFP